MFLRRRLHARVRFGIVNRRGGAHDLLAIGLRQIGENHDGQFIVNVTRDVGFETLPRAAVFDDAPAASLTLGLTGAQACRSSRVSLARASG